MSRPNKRGKVLWSQEREHARYGYEDASLVVNLAADVLLVTGDAHDTTTATLTPDEATRLRDALTDLLQEWPT